MAPALDVYDAPASVIEYIVPVVSYAAPAPDVIMAPPVVGFIAPAPSVSYAAPDVIAAPAMSCGGGSFSPDGAYDSSWVSVT